MSSLRLLNETSADTSATAIDITNVFTSDFSVYKIVSNLHFINDSDDIYIRYLSAGGNVIESSEYDITGKMLRSGDSELERPTSETNQTYGGYFNLTSGDEGGGAIMYIFTPFELDRYTWDIRQSGGYQPTAAYSYGYKGIGVYHAFDSVSGIRLYNGNGTDNFKGGKVRIYGLRVT